MTEREFSLAITGAGGAGVISVGELLLRAWARAGGRGLLRKAFGPQIRGGESAALLTLTESERYTAAERCDLLLALDWNNFTRFGDEIRLHSASVVLCENRDELPAELRALPLQVLETPFADLAAGAHDEGRANMLALGVLAAALELQADDVAGLADDKLSDKPAAYREAAVACVAAGHALAPLPPLELPARSAGKGWYVSGNQAAAYGALHAGIRFVAAYPITPASDALEYLASPLERLGGALVQAEDELAAINMALGAAYGGVPAFTATSGPGLALMSESLGLAVASETPVTVLNVMRGGPSTGIPTKSEQADLAIALHGLHGDAPHLVLAPLSVGDCAMTTATAVRFAEALQTPAIVLSDQFLGHSTAIVTPPALETESPLPLPVPATEHGDDGYRRYRLTDSGISPRAVPGMHETRFTADGLEHNERGTPSAGAADHAAQLDKRRRKLDALRHTSCWGDVRGDGAVGLVCFGSASAAVFAAQERLAAQGIATRAIALRLLSPLPVAAIGTALADCDCLFVIEQNHGAQLFTYLRGEMGLENTVHSIARPGPVPLGASTIVQAVKETLGHD
jgi:2-oxoglutarate ferredoxin oxidoreductase subunit alpha